MLIPFLLVSFQSEVRTTFTTRIYNDKMPYNLDPLVIKLQHFQPDWFTGVKLQVITSAYLQFAKKNSPEMTQDWLLVRAEVLMQVYNHYAPNTDRTGERKAHEELYEMR